MNEEVKMEDSGNQKFCLKWNNFQNNFMSQFEALKDDEDFVDVTLSCSGRSIKAHKVVLSACSPYLKNIFKEHPCKHPIVILDNISFNNLESVIQFVYTGQVYVDQSDLSTFLKTAEGLQIRGLFDSSTDQSLLNATVPEVKESDSSLETTPRKRDFTEDSEGKRPLSKRVARRVSGGAATKENIEIREKDFLSILEHKNEVNPKNSSQSLTCEGEQNYGNEERTATFSSGDEDYVSGESKRPHWLDPRSCPMCNRVYSNMSNLRQHMKLIHNPTLVMCKICFRTFKTDLYLRRHLSSFHEISLTGNGNINGNLIPVDQYKTVQGLPPGWNPTVKLEPEPFNDIFHPNEMYQVPQ